ncbi:uncharacterized protein EHS24_007380 [Apiotrichum porosum]|uniref:Diacetyl reductase [(S)-acetoin forming] n=1 Tax=Apiotrichum porosum TaxID=105984 RepID=A0A427XUA3_9TREE|nr:uncharacterized protein EHS24_007380 [Apiotrichum porosum]RSH82412.1 hypothetical protein EHS24_007380 [Apiotrichum porosum]
MTGINSTRVAIVTGAGQGIGRAIAHRLARDGFRLALADVSGNAKALDGVVTEVGKFGTKAISLPCDVRKKEDVDGLVAETAKELGQVNVMVANAGIAPTDSFMDIEPKFFDNLYEVNVRGVLFSYQAAARQMIAQGGGGKLIAACSVSGIGVGIHQTAYCSSKFAVRAINQGAALELGKYGITANVYCPGPVLTDMWKKIDDDFVTLDGKNSGGRTKELADLSPLGRCAEPEDIAKLVGFLAGPDSDFVNGQAMQCNGGAWLS